MPDIIYFINGVSTALGFISILLAIVAFVEVSRCRESLVSMEQDIKRLKGKYDKRLDVVSCLVSIRRMDIEKEKENGDKGKETK